MSQVQKKKQKRETATTRDVAPIFERMETLAEEIITYKQQMVDFDAKRQSNREALAAITKNPKIEKSKLWLCTGTDLFIRLPAARVVEQIQSDQKRIDSAINDLQKQVKGSTKLLYELQGESERVAGFDLQAMRPGELSMFK